MCSKDQAISVRELQQMLNGVLSRRKLAPCQNKPNPLSIQWQLNQQITSCFTSAKCVFILRERDQVWWSDSQHLPQHHQPDGRILTHACACAHDSCSVFVFTILVHMLPLTINQVDNTGMLEFQEFKVFWEKMKKWIVCLHLCKFPKNINY